MSMFEWEIFEDIINNRRHLNVENAGPLHAPINKLTVKRDTKLKIIINTEAGINSTSTAKSYPLGTVRTNNDFLSLTDQTTNAKINIKGIHSYHCEKSHSDQLIKETSKAQSIEILFQNKNKGKYLVEWLANMPDGLVWPDQAEKIFKETREITFGDFCKEANFESSNKITTLDSGVHMVVDRFELFLSPAFTKSEEHKKIKPGFILYKDYPPEKIRRKIRRCLSFFLGGFLVYIGHTVFCEECNLLSLEAISAYSMNNNVFDLPRLPPTPLHMEYESFIDRDILSKLVNSLYYNYESCNFGHVSWLYFHALCIPVHMAPMHFGATIEALRKSYIANNKSKIETKLINNFNDLSKCLLVELSGHEIKKTEREILENKIKNLNQVPESLLMKRFLLSLNTKLSPVEMSAWKQRNKAAHGTETDYNEFTKLIRENKVLKTIFHRLILRISGHDYYYDYYSFDHPIRNVSEGIPNESN